MGVPVILSCSSDEIEECLEHWQPPIADDVAISITLGIGDPEGFDWYYGRVVTPNNVGESAEHTIVLAWYSWEALQDAIAEIMQHCPSTYPEASEYLSRHFQWEYSNYKS